MLLALTDHLRCTEPHVETWLVARADVVEAGRMVDGVLGCPVCHAERLVTGGVTLWSPASGLRPRTQSREPHPDRVMRIGALIGFGDSDAPFILCGHEGEVAAGLGALSDTPLVLLDPPDDRAARVATIVRGAPAVPFRAASVRGIALGATHTSDAFVASCVRAVVPGGRLVAPAATPLPDGVRELARDASHWVGERLTDVVPLGRRLLTSA